MKIHLGTDICEIDRIENLYKKFGKKFLYKIFTEEEIQYSLSRSSNLAHRLAVRFATKEAVSKALGVGLNGLGWSKGVDWKDIELIRNQNGNVNIKLYNKALILQDQAGIKRWEVSVSHSKNIAISTVIGYE